MSYRLRVPTQAQPLQKAAMGQTTTQTLAKQIVQYKTLYHSSTDSLWNLQNNLNARP